MVKEELLKDKYVKTVLFIGGGVLGLFAIGFVLKAVTYATSNLKALNAILKQN